MEERIEICYNFMIENIPQFQVFVEQNKHVSTDELIQKYDIDINKKQD